MYRYDIGFLGGGQLARMSIQAAQRMGLSCLSLDPVSVTPASNIAPSLQGALDDPQKLAEVISLCERITLENEFVPADILEEALHQCARSEDCLLPGLRCLSLIQDKLLQRQALHNAGVPSPKAIAFEPGKGLPPWGFPVVLKARFGGYDGKGTRIIRSEQELLSALPSLKGEWLAEEVVPFQRELAVMVYCPAPGAKGGAGCFRTMVSEQVECVCDLVYPAEANGSAVARAAVEAVEGYGLFGVELFELEDGTILVNEIAPRPHNSGHYTLDWGGVSQFEQHVRLVMGFPPLEPGGRLTLTCMANLLGVENPGDWRRGLRAVLENSEGVQVHWYDKAESRLGRKMGHLNVSSWGMEEVAELIRRAREARQIFYEAWSGSRKV